MIHILVVDDDCKLNQTVCTYLNDCGFQAKGVLGAEAAYTDRALRVFQHDQIYPHAFGFALNSKSNWLIIRKSEVILQYGRSCNRVHMDIRNAGGAEL